MILRTQRPHRSINLGAVDGVQLEPMTVLTGQNGAGKSNLLEALQNGAVVFDDFGQLPPEQVRLFKLGELLAVAEGPVQAASYKEPWANLYNTVQQWKQHVLIAPELAADPNAQEQWVNQNAMNSKLLSGTALVRMNVETGKTLLQMTAEDFKEHAPIISGVKDPFAASISEVFLSYSQRRTANEIAQWRLKEKGRGSALSDEEFNGRFGNPPWELLDETLKLVGLPYYFTPPPEDADTLNYEVALIDHDGNSIRPGDLSSGERVLLAVAMSLFTGSRLSEAIELPRLLLLDEADASLHPSMVKSLLTVIELIFVKQYGVRVVITTHSPSTVALAPADSLFVMSRGTPKLRKASPDEALNLLTVGISALSVRLENRRQVFVESEHDQAIYQDLFRIIKASLSSERSVEFIAAGKRDAGGGCDAVKRFVADLRGAGNTTILGIIDRDKRKGAPESIFFLADRYSIENLLFDPLLLGTFLLRENIVADADLGLAPAVRHFELTGAHANSIVSALTSKLGLSGPPVQTEYQAGFTVDVPSEFLEMNGHELETRVVTTYPELRRFKGGLKREIVNKAVADVPGFVPKSVLTLFENLLS